MGINNFNPGFNKQQDQDRQAATLAELIGRSQDIQAHSQAAQALQAQKDQQEQARSQKSIADVKQLLGLKEGEAVPAGTTINVTGTGGASLGKGFNPAQVERQQRAAQSKEAQALGKLGSAIAPAEDLLSTNRRFQESLDLGSAVGDKNAAIMAARLGEGPKARIQQAVIQEFMKSGDSAQGAAAKAQNWLDGAGTTVLTPGARDQLRALGQMHYQEAKRSYDNVMSQAQQQAPLVAPSMAATGSLGQFTSSWGKRGASDSAELEKRFAARQEQGGRDINQPVQQNQPVQGGLKGFLSGIWNGRTPPQPMGNAAPNAGGPPPMSAAPQGSDDAAAKLQRLQELRAKAGMQ